MFTVTKAGRRESGEELRPCSRNLARMCCRCRPRTDQNQSNLFVFFIPFHLGTEHVLVVSKPFYKKTTHAACSANKQRSLLLERASEDEHEESHACVAYACTDTDTRESVQSSPPSGFEVSRAEQSTKKNGGKKTKARTHMTIHEEKREVRGKGTAAPQPTCSNARTSQHDGGAGLLPAWMWVDASICDHKNNKITFHGFSLIFIHRDT